MPESVQHGLPPTEDSALHGSETARRFLIESERRVIVHCQKLLAANNLPDEHRQRLGRLLEQARDQLRRMAA